MLGMRVPIRQPLAWPRPCARFLPDSIRLLTAPMPLPATGLQGNGPSRPPVLQTEARIWNPAPMPTSETHPSREPSGQATPQRGGNPYGKTTQRRSRGKTITADQIPWPMHPQISKTEAPETQGGRHTRKQPPKRPLPRFPMTSASYLPCS